MTTNGEDGTGGMDPEDDGALWSLLGRQEPPVKASPYFARRVLREIALDEQQPRRGWAVRLQRFWTLTPRHAAVWSGAFALGMLCLSAVLTIPASHPPMVRSTAMPEATVDPAEIATPADTTAAGQESGGLADAPPVQDEEIIADLDNVLNREESRLWTEDTDTGRF